jgi:hypothetical protein
MAEWKGSQELTLGMLASYFNIGYFLPFTPECFRLAGRQCPQDGHAGGGAGQGVGVALIDGQGHRGVPTPHAPSYTQQMKGR